MHGDDPFSLRQELTRWKKGFLQKHGDLNLTELDGAKLKVNELESELLSPPFLGEKRLVIVKHLLSSQKAEDLKAFEPLFDKIPDTSILLLWENQNPDKRTKIVKNLLKSATNKAYAAPKPETLDGWVQQRAKVHGAQLDFKTTRAFLTQVGSDLWTLDNELQKLALYTQGRPVTTEDIQALCSTQVEDSIFTLMDQISAQKHQAALESLKRLQEQGLEAPYLFAMIARQFKLIYDIQSLAEAGQDPKAIASALKAHPFVVQKTLPAARRIQKEQLQAILTQLLDLDTRLKTGRLHFRSTEPEHFLLELERTLLKN